MNLNLIHCKNVDFLKLLWFNFQKNKFLKVQKTLQVLKLSCVLFLFLLFIFKGLQGLDSFQCRLSSAQNSGIINIIAHLLKNFIYFYWKIYPTQFFFHYIRILNELVQVFFSYFKGVSFQILKTLTTLNYSERIINKTIFKLFNILN